MCMQLLHTTVLAQARPTMFCIRLVTVNRLLLVQCSCFVSSTSRSVTLTQKVSPNGTNNAVASRSTVSVCLAFKATSDDHYLHMMLYVDTQCALPIGGTWVNGCALIRPAGYMDIGQA